MRTDLFRRKRDGWYLLHEPIMRLWLGGMLLIGTAAPVDILDQFQSLRVVVETMTLIFPPIGAYANKSSFPQVTSLYMSIAWITAPLHWYFIRKEYATNAAGWVKKFKDPKSWPLRERIRGWISVALLIPILTYMAYFAIGHDFRLIPINSSRFALGIAGWVFSGGGVVALATVGYLTTMQLAGSNRNPARQQHTQ